MVDGRGWLLDATPDLGAQLHALGVPLGGIVLTHAHYGHVAGLLQLGREVMGTDCVPVYAMPRLRRFLLDNAPWELLIRDGHVVLGELEQGLELGSVRITAEAVPHRDEYSETVALTVQGPSRSVLYVPDVDAWGSWPPEVAVAKVDLALLDGTFYDLGELDPPRDGVAHPPIVETLARLPSELVGRVRFVHLNHTNPCLDPESEASRAVRRAGAGVARRGEVYAL